MSESKNEGPPSGDRQAQEKNHHHHANTACGHDMCTAAYLMLARLSEQIDRFTAENEKLREAQETHRQLLKESAIRLFEKTLHKVLEEYDEKQKRLKDPRSGGGFKVAS